MSTIYHIRLLLLRYTIPKKNTHTSSPSFRLTSGPDVDGVSKEVDVTQ